MKKHLISIIIPMYNVSSYINKCLQSIYNQTYSNFEVIMVDDNSNDNTVDKARYWVQKDNRFVLYCQSYNQGVSKSRNIGLKHSKGDLISFIDPDDYCDSDYLESFINNFNADITITGFYYKNKPVKCLLKTGYYSKWFIILFMLINFGNIRGYVWNKCYSRSVIYKYNLYFDNDLSVMEDMLFNINYILHINSVFYLNKPFYHYNVHSNSTIHNVNLHMIRDIIISIMRSIKLIIKN